ncbi:MAG: HIT domain-containing protein [Campylobacteraceae bacterium]|jgi:diadenosine tetraphosphate (Ap4A) HIT family hydrolase|nr:HIT domain-containing protein [Campylobacteraceae bacterium]
MIIFKNEFVEIIKEESHIPWLKIFTTENYKELTDCPDDLRQKLYFCMETVEKVMRDYYNPTKINIAMFGNYVPRLHIHVMARFEDDGFFPESMWGKKQKEPNLFLPDEKLFLEELKKKLMKVF